MSLAEENCVPCRGGVPPLKGGEVVASREAPHPRALLLQEGDGIRADAFDVVGRHAYRFRRQYGGSQPGIQVRVAPTAGGDHDLFDNAGEALAPLGVQGRFLMLDCRPF